VAYAQDEAFGGYFPDTLETLEALGADLVEFSPLRSEGLPEAVDLVMIGCGFADQYAEALASNLSLINALRFHVYQGRRIYSEGGGTAYLGRSMRIEGREIPGVGILPFDAELRPGATEFASVTCTLRCDTWLGPKGTVVRGYQSLRWNLRPTSELCHCEAGFGPLSDVGNFFYHHHAVGSMVHLHLAALPQVVEAFAGPHRPSLTVRQAGR
jgi:cobyrinic acid a,c-diamide synthase